ncbi:Tn7-like element transposition protein TnsE [Serratia proteamaculans]|uniref:Transcriptional antiterminator n=1 Tax=Serratia proteamaculans TaxID=28151 RepID=A0A5Q2VAY2_SERPR|nr:Tn7-like element transposition protein TnsE [Serratia proteamaculans]QGH61344.1 transcriptional antiterminator [Serratia proteamaculans]
MTRIKGIINNSKLTEIGSFFRRKTDAEWRINVGLEPAQKKTFLSLSQLPLVARKKVLNATEGTYPAGYPKHIVIDGTHLWDIARVSDCPIPVVRAGDNGKQWCFVFEQQGIHFYLPQLELARVLFFHHAYMARLAMLNQGISKEFDVEHTDDPDQVNIHLLPSCSLPKFIRADYSLRRILAWIILDPEIRQSFDSISGQLLNDCYETTHYFLWDFRFSPPRLEQTQLDLRGHFDKERKVFFVYQIHGVAALPGHCPKKVNFIDPAYTENQPGSGVLAPQGVASGTDLEIDEDENPGADGNTKKIDVEILTFEFAEPFETTRKGREGTASGKGEQDENDLPLSERTTVSVSTDETTVQGALPSADFDGIEDNSDDVHLYAGRFDAFYRMIDKLLTLPDCERVTATLRRLPALKRRTRHLLSDGNPRCIAFQLLQRKGQQYALLEVDTSDNQTRLSTLLIKQPMTASEWVAFLPELETLLVKKSLSWPGSFLKTQCSNKLERLSHPKTAVDGHSFFDQEAINRWAERVYAAMR